MVCYSPIKAFYPRSADSEGKRYLLFSDRRNNQKIISKVHFAYENNASFSDIFGFDDIYESPYDFPVFYDSNGSVNGYNIKIPCGKCIGCRLDYSRTWATRSIHEAFMCNHYNDCSFLTLTFNDDMLLRRENPHSLNKVAFRSWIKRLRKAIYSRYNKHIRVLYCGEYGEKYGRPHYHLLVFGFNFPDKYPFKINKVHNITCTYYRSPFLEEVWRPAHSSDSFGFSVIGDVTFESCAYVSRYIMKKQYGRSAFETYKDKEKEFLSASRMPGIGAFYFDKYYKDIISNNFVMLPNGNKTNVPRYYVERLKLLDENMYKCYKVDRFNNLVDSLFDESKDTSAQRLSVREELKRMQVANLLRKYEFCSEQKLHNI